MKLFRKIIKFVLYLITVFIAFITATMIADIVQEIIAGTYNIDRTTRIIVMYCVFTSIFVVILASFKLLLMPFDYNKVLGEIKKTLQSNVQIAFSNDSEYAVIESYGLYKRQEVKTESVGEVKVPKINVEIKETSK